MAESSTSLTYIQEIKTEKDFNRICLHNFDKLIVILFYAEWHEPSKHLINVFNSMGKIYENRCVLCYINADEVDSLTEKYKVELVPTIIFTTSTKEVLSRVEIDTPSIINQRLEEAIKSFFINFENQKSRMFPKIEEILKQYPLMVFIKGTPKEPKCGYTEQLLNVLKNLKVKFGFFDILSDENMRNWLRYYAKWMTYPQVYVQGKLVGGLDVTKDLISKGTFQEMIKDLDLIDNTLDTKIDKILTSSIVIAVIEGTPSAIKSDQSQKLLEILNDNGIKYNSFDILTAPDDIKDKLKERFGDKKAPYLIVNKEILGDLEHIQYLHQQKQFLDKIPSTEIKIDLKTKINKLINHSAVMLFMKGNAQTPVCGFSKRMVDVLNRYNVKYETFNILADQEVREGLKEVSGWKTYPQLYIEGKLIGGIDIVEELDENNEFEELVSKYQN